MKMYCPDCGAKIEYTSNKPNFCINCGHAFGNIKASQNVQEADDDDLENDQITPELYDGMQTLDVEISGGRNKGQKLGDLVGALPEDHKVPEETIKSFSEEAVKLGLLPNQADGIMK